jgi:hypothetical protein
MTIHEQKSVVFILRSLGGGSSQVFLMLLMLTDGRTKVYQFPSSPHILTSI